MIRWPSRGTELPHLYPRVSNAVPLLLALFILGTCPFHRAIADTFGTGADMFAIEFVTIGDPGNIPDWTGWPRPVGTVDDVYRIGKFEISRGIVTKASAAGNLSLTMDDMTRNGGNRPEMPATGVNWNEAARFINWLNTSQGHQAAYKFRSQPGDADYDPNENILLWEPGDAGFDEANRFRNSQATYFLPDVNEWYKAAYFDPTAGYWDYATGSNALPISVASGTDPGTAVYDRPRFDGPADVHLAGGLSPYGVMGLGGNVFELQETEADGTNDDPASVRIARGGGWADIWSNRTLLAERLINDVDPVGHLGATGFRVASVADVIPGNFDPGDFDKNRVLDVKDIDLLFVEVRARTHNMAFDLNSDDLVNHADRDIWVHELKQTYFGDTNLDGDFGSADLVQVFLAGEYEDDLPINSTWITGDWDGDGDFTTSDIVLAFRDGGYERGRGVAMSPVPEPSTCLLLVTTFLILAARFRSRGSRS